MAKTPYQAQDLAILPGKNLVINGAFDFWQRGTSFTSSSTLYTADRWFTNPSGGTYTLSRQAHTPGEMGSKVETQYYLRYQATVADDNQGIYQYIEDGRQLSGKKCTAIFWARKTSGVSTLSVQIGREYGSGGSPSPAEAVNTMITTSSSWVQYAVTVTLPSISGKTFGTNNNDRLYIGFINPNNELSQFDISQVMLLEGELPVVDFSRAGINKQGELALCQRYYEKSYNLTSDPNSSAAAQAHVTCDKANTATTTEGVAVPFTVRKRGVPTITVYPPAGGSAGSWQWTTDNGAGTVAAASVSSPTETRFTIGFTTASGLAVNEAVILKGHWVADAEL